MKILVFATDVTPLPGLPTSGTALRTAGFAEGFRELGHEVVISVPKTALAGLRSSFPRSSLRSDTAAMLDALERDAFDPLTQDAVLRRHAPDLIYCGHWPAVGFGAKPEQPLVVDLAGPHLLERHYLKAPDQRGAVLGKLGALATADYFITSGDSQSRYFESFLARAGVVDYRARTTSVFMPLDARVPTRTAARIDSPKFVFGGVFLPWQDPSHALLATAEACRKRAQGSLKLIGGKHPNYPITAAHYEKLFAELQTNPRVTSHPMLPYDQFVEQLIDADVAVDLMSWNLEREFAITIRSTTYLWAGVPIIYNNFADLGQLVRDYDAGWSISPNDSAALEAVIEEIFTQPEVITRKSENASRLAREQFSRVDAAQRVLDLVSTGAHRAGDVTDIVVDAPEVADHAPLENRPLRQLFRSRREGLNAVQCFIATHGRNGVAPLTMTLREVGASSAAPSGAVIATRTFQSSELADNAWLSVSFDPISASRGSFYSLELSSPAKSDAQAASVWMARSSPYPLLELSIGERCTADFAMCLRTKCRAAVDASSATSFRAGNA